MSNYESTAPMTPELRAVMDKIDYSKVTDRAWPRCEECGRSIILGSHVCLPPVEREPQDVPR